MSSHSSEASMSKPVWYTESMKEGGCPEIVGCRTSLSKKKTTKFADRFWNDQLLSWLTGSPGRLLVILVHGTWWHHHSRHWGSGPRHPSLYGVCAEEHQCIGIYSLPFILTFKMKTAVWPPLSKSLSNIGSSPRSNPDTFWARQCWVKWKHEMGTCSTICVINYRQ